MSIETIPPVTVVRDRIGHLLRELHVARRLLPLAKLAEEYRQIESQKAPTTPPTEKRGGVICGWRLASNPYRSLPPCQDPAHRQRDEAVAFRGAGPARGVLELGPRRDGRAPT